MGRDGQSGLGVARTQHRRKQEEIRENLLKWGIGREEVHCWLVWHRGIGDGH